MGSSSGKQTRSTPTNVDAVVRRQKPERFRGNGTTPCHSLQEKITFLHEIFTSATAEVVLPSWQPWNWCSTRTSEGSVKVPQNWGAGYREAFLEIDRQKMTGKIESAVAVLQDSLAELDSPREHLSGKQLISDAFAHDTAPRTTRSRPNRAAGDGHTQVRNSGSRRDHCRY